MRAPIIAIIAVAVLAVSIAGGLCRPGIELALATLPTPTPTFTPAPPNTWGFTGSLQQPRAQHLTAPLPGGDVLAVGGLTTGGAFPLRERYFDESFAWTLLPGGDPTYANTATALADGRVLVTIFDYALGTETIARIYDPANHVWSPAGSLMTHRLDHTATLMPDGTVLVIGGTNAQGCVTATERYDPVSNAWSADIPSEFHHARHTATLLGNGSVLVSAGLDNFSQTVPAERFDETAWSFAGSAAGRSFSTATLLQDGRVLLVGGQPYTVDPQIYDPSSNSWSNAGEFRRTDHRATLLADGRVLVSGGDPELASAALYDPTSNSWTAAASMNIGRRSHGAELLPDGRVLVMGGVIQPFAITNSAELYAPGGVGETFTPTNTATPTNTPTATITPGGPPTNTHTFTPTSTPTSTNTPGNTPTMTPTPPSGHSDLDCDQDGCRDWQEHGANRLLGGERDANNPYDFYDVNVSRKVDGIDISLVRANFNASGPLPPEDVIYDRGEGAAAWAPGPPDGVINAVDIGLVRASFGHSCKYA